MDLRNEIERKKEFITRHGIFDEHIDRYVFSAELIQKRHSSPIVLDIACGKGFGAWILSHAAGRVVAADINREDVDFAKKNFAAAGVDYLVADAAELPFAENAFDAAVSLETIEHLDLSEQKKFLSGLKKCVKRGGLIVISTPDHAVWDSQAMHQHDHKQELTKKELEILLARFFSVKELYGVHLVENQPFIKRIARTFFIFLKRLDVFGLRYKLIGKNLRRALDVRTSPLEKDTWPVLLGPDEVASDLIAVCCNKK